MVDDDLFCRDGRCISGRKLFKSNSNFVCFQTSDQNPNLKRIEIDSKKDFRKSSPQKICCIDKCGKIYFNSETPPDAPIFSEDPTTFLADDRTKEKEIDTYDLSYISTGRFEKSLVKKVFDIIVPHEAKKPRFTTLVENTISRIIREKALKEGYESSDFPERSWYKRIKRVGEFKNNFLEKYEFLFRFSTIYDINIRKALLEAIKIYRQEKGFEPIRKIHKSLLKEYKLVKGLQEAYFKEHKKYITRTQISREATGTEKTYRAHFERKEPFKFRSFSIFQIEYWAKKNLNVYLGEIQDQISEWREENNDNSLYARQDTPFKDIAYNIIILYAQVNNILIHRSRLDELLYERFPENLPQTFFHRRINQERDSKGIITSLDLYYKPFLVTFIKENFQNYAPLDTQRLIEKIDSYINKENIRLSRSYFFTLLKPYQLKILLDITKGLDPLYCNFFNKNEPFLPDMKGGICRAHIDEDTDYIYIFSRFLDGEKYSYRFKLAPLRFLSSHIDTHNALHFPTGLANNLIEARMRHLYELHKMSYNSKLSEKEYINLFRNKFRNKKDYIFQYDKEVYIWNDLYDEKNRVTISGLSDENIIKFVLRWIDFNKKSEASWYNDYYKEFYYKKYVPFMKKVESYRNKQKNQETKEPFFDFFLNEYLPNEIFP